MIGHALGSPYGIPHGITSCLTLADLVKLRPSHPAETKQIARALPPTGKGQTTENDRENAIKVGDAIDELINGLGLGMRLTEYV